MSRSWFSNLAVTASDKLIELDKASVSCPNSIQADKKRKMAVLLLVPCDQSSVTGFLRYCNALYCYTYLEGIVLG